jgi:hypothetical protein
MQRRSVRRNDPRYKQLRTRNNESVKKSREKCRREQDETIQSINQLELDNQQLIENIQILKEQYEQLHTIFKQHTGIDIDQMSPSTSKLPSSSPKDESSSTPVLAINTTENNSSSNNELDVNNLDGSIVLINGVQYKIVSMTKT